MKYFKINDNKVYFIKKKEEAENWTEIDKIEKNDLMNLLNWAIEDDFEMDEYDIDKIANKSHQIIYKHLSEKFTTFSRNKDRFKDETDAIYKEALEKYQ